MAPAGKEHCRDTVVELSRDSDCKVIPCPTLQCEVVVRLGTYERNEQLLIILPHRDVNAELIPVADRVFV